MRDDIVEEMDRGEYIKVEEERYNKLLENEEYYKTAIGLIKDEMYGLKSLEHGYAESMKEIGRIIEELEMGINAL